MAFRIVCDDKIPFLKGVFERWAEVKYMPGAEIGRGDLVGADALITRTRTRCDAALLDGTGVRIVATATIGIDHIDTGWCDANGVRWVNAPGCNAGSVQQYVCSLLCAWLLRHGLELEGLTLGVVGVGNVGSKVAAAARVLGFRVLLCDPPRSRREGADGFVDIDTLIDCSDIVTLHTPLTREGEDATFHLMDESRLERMGARRVGRAAELSGSGDEEVGGRDGGNPARGRSRRLLVNSSRGPVVDCAALERMLAEGRIEAALDVFEGEPAVSEGLLERLFVATPHIAGYSADGKAAGTTAAVRAVAKVLGIKELESWVPEALPAPAQATEFEIDTAGKLAFGIVSQALLYTYDILTESAVLKSAPESFEWFRGAYPVRREAPAYSLRLRGPRCELAEKQLAALGFGSLAR